jgi:hypothetical protein
MLPTWAVVVITLGGSGITAFAALGGSFLRAELERRERWRDRLVAAADDFSTAIERALLAVRDSLDQLHEEGAAGNTAEASRAIDETVASAARVELLFGATSEPASAARNLLGELRRIVWDAERGDADAFDHNEKPGQLRNRFNSSALEAIGPPRRRLPMLGRGS